MKILETDALCFSNSAPSSSIEETPLYITADDEAFFPEERFSALNAEGKRTFNY
jgi:hypothetical protein